MSKSVSLFSLVLLLMIGWSLQAEEAIGVVDWRRALFQSDAAKTADAKMKKENQSALDRLTVLEGKVEATRKKLTKDQDLLSDSEIKKLEGGLQKDFAEFNTLRSRLQEIQLTTESNFVTEQKERIDKAMEQLAKKYKLTIVLDRQAIVYGKNPKELTQELTDVLNSTQ